MRHLKIHILFALLLALLSVPCSAQLKSFNYTPLAGGPSYFVSADQSTKEAAIMLNDDYAGEVVIPNEIPDNTDGTIKYAVRTIAKAGFLNKSITKVTLPANLRILEIDAFRECSKLTAVTFNEGLVSIGYMAFAKCTLLGTGSNGDLTLPTTLTTLDNDAFYLCWNINHVNFDKLVNLKKIGDEAFRYDGGTGVTPTGKGLMGDLVLAEGLEEIGARAFVGAPNLTGKLVLPSTLRIIGDAPFSVSAVPFTGDLVLPDKLEQIGSFAFIKWKQPMDNFKWPSKLKSIGTQAFVQANALGGHLEIPASVEEIKALAFFGCFRVTSVSLAKGSQLKRVGNRLFNNYWLNYIDFRNAPIKNFSTYTDADGNEVAYDYSNGSEGVKINRLLTGVFGRLCPYTLVYLPMAMTDESLVAGGEVNFIQNGKCKHFRVDDDYKSGYEGVATRSYQAHPFPNTGSTYVPDYPYAARGCDYGSNILFDFTADTATYVRTLSANKVMSVMLPYQATIPTGVRAYKLLRKLNSGELYFLSTDDPRLEMDDNKRTVLEAYTPYLLKFKNGVSSASFGEDTNLTIAVPPSLETIRLQNTTADGYAFLGTTENIYHTAAATLGAYNLSNNVWYPVTTGNTAGFVHSMRAFVVPPSTSAARRFAFIIEPYDDITGINTIAKDVEEGKARIYTANGKYVGTDFNALPTGQVYIVGGKKVYKY